ncbi:MAG: methylated-DNA--[protein]-cysteine S-methyltransferase [Thermomicrobiales bacterium]
MAHLRESLYPVGQFGLGWGNLSRRTLWVARMKANGRMDFDESAFRAADAFAAQGSEPLLSRASRPDIDPCGVAEDAMPGYLVGDLDDSESRWVRSHIAGCTWCNQIFRTFSDVNEALDNIKAIHAQDAFTQHPPSAAKLLGLRQGWYGFMDTECGQLLIANTDEGVCAVSWLRHTDRENTLREIEARGILASESQAAVTPVIDQLKLYFAGLLKHFDLSVDLIGTTEFTRRALDGIRSIPFGEVVTYGDVARTIGQPGATQAVGNAMGKNPIPIIIPCHRVIRSDGSMGNYTGGADIKTMLLKIEGVDFDQRDDQPSLPLDFGF